MTFTQVSLRLVCCLVASSASIHGAQSAVIGGWNSSRGGASALSSGGDFSLVRSDLNTLFQSNSIVTTQQLTPAFLQGVDVLLLDVVQNVLNVQISPLTGAEQAALTDWVAAGGRALIVVENDSYYEASRSMTEPFGLQWADGFLPEVQTGVMVDHTTYPQITNGPFGVVNAFGGWYPSWFIDASAATALGTWNANGSAAIAAMKYGAGRVVFFGDDALIANYFGQNNTVLRRNTLNYLINVPETDGWAFHMVGSCGVLAFSSPRRLRLARAN